MIDSIPEERRPESESASNSSPPSTEPSVPVQNLVQVDGAGAVCPGTASEATIATSSQPEVPPPEPDSGAAVASDASSAQWQQISSELAELRQFVCKTHARLIGVESLLENTAKQFGFLPPQLRALGARIDSLGTTLSEPRYRGLLLNLLGIHDLVDQLLRSTPAVAGNDCQVQHRHNYEVLRTQLRQILEANGLSEIPAVGPFNPECHRAMESVPCDTPEADNQVAGVLRPGFRAGASVLRYAEVCVSRYKTPGPGSVPAPLVGPPTIPTEADLPKAPGIASQQEQNTEQKGKEI